VSIPISQYALTRIPRKTILHPRSPSLCRALWQLPFAVESPLCSKTIGRMWRCALLLDCCTLTDGVCECSLIAIYAAIGDAHQSTERVFIDGSALQCKPQCLLPNALLAYVALFDTDLGDAAVTRSIAPSLDAHQQFRQHASSGVCKFVDCSSAASRWEPPTTVSTALSRFAALRLQCNARDSFYHKCMMLARVVF
jgi:hypothetical protein